MPDPNTQQGRKSIEELIKGAPTPITLPTTRPNAATSTASLSMDFANTIRAGGPSSTSIRDSENVGHLAGRSGMHRAVTSVREASHNSTPGRPTLGSTPKQAKVKHVENQLEYDLENYKNTGIDANEFLRNALMLDEHEYEKLKVKIDAITMNVTGTHAYKDQLEVFKNTTAVESTSKESAMYKPFVMMGNMLLQELEKANPDKAKQVYLCYNGDRQVKLANKNRPAMSPDILLVPKSVAVKGRKKSKGLDIREVLSPFEFKLKKNPGNGTRKANDTSMTTPTSQAADADVFQSMPMVSASQSCVSAGTVETGKKRKAGQQATDESNKAARGEEGCTAGSASRINMIRDMTSEPVLDTDPHGRRQLARYAAAALSDRGDRQFVYGVRVNAREMTFVFYHRSGIVEADAFDFCEHPEYLTLFLYMFQHDPTTYGFNATTGYRDPFDIYKESATTKMDIKDKLVEKNEEFVKNKVYDDLETSALEAAEYCIVGRGGSVHKVVAPNHDPEKVPAMAVKFSWQSTSRKHEIENMEIARRCIPKNVAETYGYATIADDTPFEALRNACSRPQKNYTEKTFRVLVMKHYQRLSEVDDMDIFWELIRQLIICLHKLYVEQKLLHRDISIGNLAWEMVNGKPVIIILDFELATVVGDEVRTNEVRTGTAPFMAREVLKGFESGYTHTLNHDLESVYYIAYWHVVGYRGYKLPTFEDKLIDPLQSWWFGSYQQMYKAKVDHMSELPGGEDDLLKILKRDLNTIGTLSCIRRLFRARSRAVKNLVSAHKGEIDASVEAVRKQAKAAGLSKTEIMLLLTKKEDELKLEAKRRTPTLSISFKEWLDGSEIFFPADVIDCKCDSCHDDLAKINGNTDGNTNSDSDGNTDDSADDSADGSVGEDGK